jgi:HemY protein
VKLGLLLVVVAVVLGGLIGTLVVRDPGYVLLSYGDMAFETSLWFALVLLALAYLALRLLFWIFSRTMAGTGRFGSWLKRRKATKAQKQTVQGLLLMSEGQWAEARKVLTASAREVNTPLINYLTAARAAHELGDAEGRDELLRSAHESTPGSKFAVGLTQAELQKSAAQWEQSLATLLQLKSSSPRHPQVLTMLTQVYEELADWQALLELLPEVKKRKIFTDDAFADLQQRAWAARFAQAGAVADNVWRDVPKDLKRSPTLVTAYARALIGRTGDVSADADANAADQAEAAIRVALQQTWDDDLVVLYGLVAGADPNRQLVVAEGWVKEKPNDPKLLLTLGRICLMNQAWPKAREYFETSLRLQRSQEVYGELGRLCVAMGDSERGSEYLAHATVPLPALPLP